MSADKYPSIFSRQTEAIVYLFISEQHGKKWRPSLRPLQVKKSSKLIFCGVYYLTVLVDTRTTIHLSVGG